MLWMFKQTDLNVLSNFFIGADFNGDEQRSGNSDVSELVEVLFINKSNERPYGTSLTRATQTFYLVAKPG
jgi:hypothetical protein